MRWPRIATDKSKNYESLSPLINSVAARDCTMEYRKFANVNRAHNNWIKTEWKPGKTGHFDENASGMERIEEI